MRLIIKENKIAHIFFVLSLFHWQRFKFLKELFHYFKQVLRRVVWFSSEFSKVSGCLLWFAWHYIYIYIVRNSDDSIPILCRFVLERSLLSFPLCPIPSNIIVSYCAKHPTRTGDISLGRNFAKREFLSSSGFSRRSIQLLTYISIHVVTSALKTRHCAWRRSVPVAIRQHEFVSLCHSNSWLPRRG